MNVFIDWLLRTIPAFFKFKSVALVHVPVKFLPVFEIKDWFTPVINFFPTINIDILSQTNVSVDYHNDISTQTLSIQFIK